MRLLRCRQIVVFALSAAFLTVASESSGAAERAKLRFAGPYVGPWTVELTASAFPSADALKNDSGTEISRYGWSMQTLAPVMIEGDRWSSEAVKIGKSEEPRATGSEFRFVERGGTFLHVATWKTPDGTERSYAFRSAATLKGSGRFTPDSITLKLAWETTAGEGIADGKTISEPVAALGLESEWKLEPGPRYIPLGTGVPHKWIYTGRRTVKLPQHLAGCPPIEVVEHVVVRQAEVADLSVSVAKLEPGLRGAQGPEAGYYGLRVAVKNAGPELTQTPRLIVTLPKTAAARFTDKKDDGSTTIDGPRVEIRLRALPAGQTREVEIPFAFVPSPAQSPTRGEAVDEVLQIETRHDGYDPKPADNRLTEPLPTRKK
jgi:hypothetical protein